MKHLFCTVALGAASLAQASLLDDSSPVTLDPAEMSRAWQAVSSGSSPAVSPAADSWQEAMLQADAELSRVLLLAWLQEQNPLRPLAAFAQDYAAALGLHRSALAGQPAACAALATAYRAGTLGALQLPPSEQKARWFEQRALAADKLPR
jgi:TPR repeat protein